MKKTVETTTTWTPRFDVGAVVWYLPLEAELGGAPPDQPFAAIVCRVHSDDCVNLVVFDASGAAFTKLSVERRNGKGDGAGQWELPK